MAIKEITKEEIARNQIEGNLPDRPSQMTLYGGKVMTPAEVKAAHDKLPKLIAERFNDLIFAIGATGKGSLADAIPTGIRERHTLSEMLSDITSGEFAAYLAIGETTLEDFYYRLLNTLSIIGEEAPTEETAAEKGTAYLHVSEGKIRDIYFLQNEEAPYRWARYVSSGGYYYPHVDDGILTFLPTDPDMPAVPPAGLSLPATKEGDEGKVLTVEDGRWVAKKNQAATVDGAVVQATGVSETAVMSQKAASGTFANAVKNSASGEYITLTDVSPATHTVKASVSGVDDPSGIKIARANKNLFYLSSKASEVTTRNGVTGIYDKANHTVLLNGESTIEAEFDFYMTNQNDFIVRPSGKYTVSLESAVPNGCYILMQAYEVGSKATHWLTNLCRMTEGQKESGFTIDSSFELVIYFTVKGGSVIDNYLFKPQIEFGNIATEYETPDWTIFSPDSDGVISGMTSLSPAMTLLANTDGVTINAAYNREITEVVKEIVDDKIRKSSDFPYEDYNLPVVYLDGNTVGMDKDNSVTLNYRYGDRTGTCTLKWQGASSISYPKKNYTVKFDNAFEAADGWGEEKKYCLKADWIDFSHCRNLVSAKLWGEVVKSRAASDLVTTLSALQNGGAVDGFPCFVVINGEWMGVYNFNMSKDGYMFGMGSGSKEAILCADNPNGYGCRWWSTATVGIDYSLEYVTDEDNADWVETSLNTMIGACTDCLNSGGVGLDTTVAKYIDLDSAIDYYIFSALSFNCDGIGKNHILATYDGTKWFFSAYDLDATWGLHWDGTNFLSADTSLTENEVNSFARMSTRHRIFYLIYNYAKDRLIARYNELRRGALSVAAISRRFYNYASRFPLAAKIADAKKWTDIPSTDVNNVSQIVTFCAERARLLDEELNGSSALPQWTGGSY